MGLPEIQIDFYKKSQSFIRRSSRGIVCLIVQDDTRQQPVTPIRSYADIVSGDWTETTGRYLKMIFKGGPGGVIAVRMQETEGEGQIGQALEMIRDLNFDYLCIPQYKMQYGEAVKTFLEDIRKAGKKGKAVLPGFKADSSAIINFTTTGISMKWDDEEDVLEPETAEYCCRIAGICAGIPLTRSVTYYVLDEVLDTDQAEDANARIDAGELVIVFDGEKFKIARGVNSLQTVTETEPEDFKKIKIREGADIVRHDIYMTFYDDYVGKLNNTYDNKQAFVGSVNRYFADLEGQILDGEAGNYAELDTERIRKYLQDNGTAIDEMTDQKIREANTGSCIYITGKIRFLDALEDLHMVLEM